MKNKLSLAEVLGSSRRGKGIIVFEMAILMAASSAIIGFVILVLLAEKPINEALLEIIKNTKIGACIGVFIGVFIADKSIIFWRIFKPTAEEIATYKEKKKIEYQKEIKTLEEKLKALD